MIDELREEEIVNKVGGRFKLSTLIQKRLVALNSGARPLIDTTETHKMKIVVQEILQDKIYLDAESNVQIVGEPTKGAGPPELDLGDAMNELADRELLLGVTGGIAAYKAAALVSRLVQAGAGVSVVMTRCATQLVGPKTFESLSGRPVLTDLFGPGAHPHIEPAGAAELLCVAPATANILAKAAHGLADDLLSTLLLVFEGPVIMAPAMNARMWAKPAVQRNVAQLRADGVMLIGPERGLPQLWRAWAGAHGGAGGDLRRDHPAARGKHRPGPGTRRQRLGRVRPWLASSSLPDRRASISTRCAI